MIRTVIQDNSEINDRKSSQISPRRSVFNAFLNRWNIVLRNRAAENIVHELELGPARQRFHLDFAIAVLAMTAGLFFVASLHVGFAANGLAIRHLRRLQHHFGVIPLLHFGNCDFNVLLPISGNQKFFGLRIAEKAEHGIFFHELVNSGTEFVFVRARLRLNGKRDGWLRQLHPWILNGSRFIAERIAGECVF